MIRWTVTHCHSLPGTGIGLTMEEKLHVWLSCDVTTEFWQWATLTA